MYSDQELAEYLQELRDQVCSRCIEKPPGGPPCAPLGKRCGIELDLPQLIDSVHRVRSGAMDPYIEAFRRRIPPHSARRARTTRTARPPWGVERTLQSRRELAQLRSAAAVPA